MDSYKKSEIANIIKVKRKEKGISQAELARRLGYTSRSAINKIELGINDIPRAKIDSFAKALDIDPSLFIAGSSTENITEKDNENSKKELMSIISCMSEKEICTLLHFAESIVGAAVH